MPEASHPTREDVEEWLARAECPECRNVIWVDIPQRVGCLCGASWIEADGTLRGAAEETNNGRMIAFIRSDHGREVSLNRRLA